LCRDATGADDAAEKINHLTLQLNMAQTETNERNSALIRAQEKLGKKEAELTVKEEELVQKNVELLEAENKLKAKDEDLIGKEDQLAHMGDQLTSREGELARAQKVIEEKDAEIVKLIEQLAANEREMKRRYEELWVEHRIKLEKDRELSNREGAAEKIQTDNAVNHMLEKQPIAAPTQKTNNDNTHGVTWSKRAGEQSVISGGGSRAITTSRSTGLDVKLAGLGWDFDDS
jgi:chromosome segregation ATPase